MLAQTSSNSIFLTGIIESHHKAALSILMCLLGFIRRALTGETRNEIKEEENF